MKVMGVVGKGNSPHIRAIEPGDVAGMPQMRSPAAQRTAQLLDPCSTAEVVVVGRTGGPKNKVLRAIVTRMRRAFRQDLRVAMWRIPWPWGYPKYSKMGGLFHGKSH